MKVVAIARVAPLQPTALPAAEGRTGLPTNESGRPAGDAGSLPVLSVLYRGRLASCNYACAYCPFAKRRDSREALARDAADLARFVGWALAQTRPLQILFTPWGEAMIRKPYRQAMLALASADHVRTVSIQTNLSGPTGWLADAPRGRIGLWCTYHPGETTLARFVDRCRRVAAHGARHSVGVVALREHFDDIRALRAALPPETYLWLNAYNDLGPGYYTDDEAAWLGSIDPWFGFNARPARSAGRPCRAGSEAISVDGDGTVRRCHFLPELLGNLYAQPIGALLDERTCRRRMCDCYIGYAQRRDLPFADDFGDGLLMRVPAGWRYEATNPTSVATQVSMLSAPVCSSRSGAAGAS
jgi:hypothetical protein